MKKRQEIGRGLRLCVDQNGVRHHGFEINTLTVMANESYDEFADRLQKEYEEDGIRFGVLEPHDFAAIPVTQEDGTTQPLGVAESKAIYVAMQQSGYIDKHGVIQDTMRTALAEHRLQLPLTAEPQRAAIEHIAKKAAGKLAVRKKENRQTLHLRKGVLLSPAFQELWERIKWKTTYHVAFDSRKLVDEIARRIADELTVPAPKLMLSTALLSVSEASIEATETGYVNRGRIQSAAPLPDIVTYLQNETNLTRKSIVDALIASRRLHLFRKNPQVFMDGVAKIMRDVMQGMIVDGIKYTKIGDDSFYAQELFEKEELTGYLEQNMIESRHSLYNYVVYDSDNEKGFAQALGIPLIEVNHLQAHVLSHFIKETDDSVVPQFPFICLLVSGGHTQILLLRDHFDMEVLGQTIDDAAGEAIDKAAKIMDLGYPGGPIIDRLAKEGNADAFHFATPHIPGYDYSFSGIKTSFLYFLRDRLAEDEAFIERNKADLCASIQQCIVGFLMKKLERAVKDTGVKQVAIAGGVSANSLLRSEVERMGKRRRLQVFVPKMQYCTDNAAMVGIAGYFKYLKGEFADISLPPYAKD